MRVPNLSLYSNTNYQLNLLTNNLNDANEIMATQKQINSISDDPVGFAQVLDLSASIDNLEQFSSNIDMGISWLSSSESAIDTIQTEIIDAKTLAIQLANASASATERANAVESIDGIIEQLLSMANTQVNGSYIFGGTETDTAPFAYDDEDNPTSVVYSGNNKPFSIQASSTSTLAVGRDGEALFGEVEILVDSTNNKIFFQEDPGKGENSVVTLDGTIPDGSYTPEELAIAVENVLNSTSGTDGYGLTYEVDYDADNQTFSIMNDGSYEGFMQVDMLWESGEEARITNVNTSKILEEGVDIDVLNGDALTIETPDPEGTAPIRLTWDEEDGVWNVLNDPGYGLELEIDGTDSQVELDLTGDGVSDIMITMESPAEDGGYIEFDIDAASEEHSIGPDLGFNSGDVSYVPPSSSSAVVLRSFDNTNNVIDFIEDNGTVSTQRTAVIPEGDYTDMDELANDIETAMEKASYYNINYEVSYDSDANKFTIEEDGSDLVDLQMLWNSGTNSTVTAGDDLGYDTSADAAGLTHTSDNRVALFTITSGSNDTINFKEVLPGSSEGETIELTATIASGDYYDPESLARAVEDAMEDASADFGNRVDYEVSYSYNSQTFSIEEDGTVDRQLDELVILWGTGSDTDKSAADVMGFDETDVTAAPMQGDPISWGIFETLFDLRDYLGANDVDGIQRSITRLDTHYDSITSVLSDIGMKYDRLTTIQQVGDENVFTLTERRSMIEDADFAESVMDLKAIQTAYEASLSSTAQIINISLMDYI